jgi:hypothetical protein
LGKFILSEVRDLGPPREVTAAARELTPTGTSTPARHLFCNMKDLVDTCLNG